MFEFQPGEIAEKKRRVRELMEARGLDGLYLKRTANFSWITGGGYNIVGFSSEVGVAGILLTADRDFVVCNNIEAPRMEDEERLSEQGYEMVSFPWFEDKEAELVRSLSGPKLGADHAFPGSQDVSGALNPLRYSLTPWEVERITAQAKETALAVEETALEIRPGDEERAVIGRLSSRLWSRGMDFVTAFCAADDRISRYRHPVATDAAIRKRAMISVNSRRRGLIVSLTRFVQFGSLSADLRKRYEDNVQIDCIMMAATRPGRAASEVFLEAVKAYVERGYPEEYRLHHQGGAIGYVGRDYRATERTADIIRENQAFTWNPSITGVKSEDTMLATASGPVVLSEPAVFPVLETTVNGYTFRRPDILEV